MKRSRSGGPASVFGAPRHPAIGTGRFFAYTVLLLWSVVVVSASRPAGERLGEGSSRIGSRLPYADGAPAGFSGAFGENSCQACHFDADVNTGPGQVTLDGVPERFVGGSAYRLTITVHQPQMQVGGFQLTARFKSSGAQAGSLAAGPGEEQVKIETLRDVQYANQRRSGLPPTDHARWTVTWMAPSAGGIVVFHVAANAADGDETASGDYVFTAVRESASAGQ